jgi:hypothetical protein
VTGRRGRICKQLLDDIEEKRGYRKLKEEAVDRTVWGTPSSETVDLSYGMSECQRDTLVSEFCACGLVDPSSPRGCGWKCFLPSTCTLTLELNGVDFVRN